MFQFRRFPSYTYLIQYMMLYLLYSGLLHSDICGSILACNSPQLFAAYHVLHRLPMPRHSPCALFSLTIFFQIVSYARFLMRLKFSKFVVLPHNQLSLFVRKISFLFSSCIFTLLYSVFKVLLGTSFLCFRSLVGTSGLEPPTSRLSGVRSNHLSYAPMC